MAFNAYNKDGKVTLSAAYHISVYATADGYSASDKASNVNCSLFSPFSCYSIVKYSLNINVFEKYIRLFMVAGESALLFK